jgi:hypothetical protein
MTGQWHTAAWNAAHQVAVGHCLITGGKGTADGTEAR